MTETSPPPAGPAAPAGPQAGPGPSRHLSLVDLRRSVADRKIAGVSGGLGRHLGIDPTIIRVALVVLCFFGGAGFLLYAVGWLVVPEDGRDTGRIPTAPTTRNVVLIATGVLAALLLVGRGWAGFGFPWPLLVVGAGVAVYLAIRNGSQQSPGASYPPPGPPVEPGTYPGTHPPGSYAPGSYAPGSYAGAAPQTDPAGWGGTTTAPPWLPPTPAAPAPEPPRRKHGPRLFGPTLAVVAVGLGALGIADAAGVDVVAPAYAALALALVGAMLVLGSVLGRPGGLILLGILALFSLGVTSAVSGTRGFEDHGRDRLHVTPTTADGVRDTYFIPAGQAVVDLSKVRDPAELAGRSIEIGARAGEIDLVLPPEISSEVHAEVTGPGQVDLPGRQAGGVGPELRETLGSGPGTVTIRTHLFAGHIDVRNP